MEGKKGGGPVLKTVTNMGSLPFDQLREIYAESNAAQAREQWPDLEENEARLRAELDFYQYLRQDFFTMEGSFYALWLENGRAVSALRLEPWRGGWLLEGLETHPDHRGRGYAKALMKAALGTVEGQVRAHVHRDNGVSRHVHEACGFHRSGDTAMVDGSYLPGYLTFLRE